MILKEIAYFHSPFTSKFGVPKQSGLVDELEGTIEFASEFRNKDMLRGIEDFDYLWIIWQFSANPHAATSPLVRPPLLGGNEKVGVFASRSPFRPNAMGLSSVRLSRVDYTSSPTLAFLTVIPKPVVVLLTVMLSAGSASPCLLMSGGCSLKNSCWRL